MALGDFLQVRFKLLARLGRARTIFFAQYGEDMTLKQLHPARTGRYVDVGAYHPWRASNTFKLYLLGWRGLTIEPNPDVAPMFRRARPGDTHLTMGVAATRAELMYRRFADAKLNSFSTAPPVPTDEPAISTQMVACAPLSEIIAQHYPDQKVDLLSIDCESLDYVVLQSLDWQHCRPTVIVIEDFDQFTLTYHQSSDVGKTSNIQKFLLEKEYSLVSQNFFSYIYVDRLAVSITGRLSGFHLNDSQIASFVA